jgi:menaquinone-dependent protoporphyrinogen IX oxidase
MKTLIIYQSKYGSTKQYADWIVEGLLADVRHVSSVDSTTLSTYDIVVFGSYLHAGKIVDIDFLTKNWTVLESKKIVLFTVSGAPAGSEALTKAFEKALPQNIKQKIKWFQFQGRVVKTDTKDTLLLFFAKMMFYTKSILQGKYPKFNPYAPFDKMDKSKINSLISYVKGLI